MSSAAETIGERIKAVRGGVSQDAFGEQLGVAKDTIGKYERNRIVPGGDVLTRIHVDFGVDINWLLTGKGSMKADASGEGVNAGALAGAITAVEEMLRARQITLTSEKKGKMIAILYKQLTDVISKGQIADRTLTDLLSQAS